VAFLYLIKVNHGRHFAWLDCLLSRGLIELLDYQKSNFEQEQVLME
jgi:hypothetical protein